MEFMIYKGLPATPSISVVVQVAPPPVKANASLSAEFAPGVVMSPVATAVTLAAEISATTPPISVMAQVLAALKLYCFAADALPRFCAESRQAGLQRRGHRQSQR